MNPSILLVDDEPSICSALNRTFRKNNFDVFQANSGEQALSLLKEKPIDIVLSDQKMPGMTGVELLSIVKNEYPNVSRMILSGHSDFTDMTEAINEANIARFLPKPWDDSQLLDMVTSILPTHSLIGKENVVPFNPMLQASPEPMVKFGGQQTVTVDIEKALLQKQIDLETAINHDLLLLNEQEYFSYEDKNTLCYLTINWPKFQRFQHEGIINIASQSGYLHSLFTWYLIHIISHVEANAAKYMMKKRFLVVDLFFDGFVKDHSLRSLLNILLKDRPHIILRTPYESAVKAGFTDFLLDVYNENNSLLLNLGKRVVDLEELGATPVRYVEMDGRYSAMNNVMLTEKRLKMINDAKNMKIKTILSKDQPQIQHNYVRSMGFDFF